MLTAAEIRMLPAGPEGDRLVAEAIGWQAYPHVATTLHVTSFRNVEVLPFTGSIEVACEYVAFGGLFVDGFSKPRFLWTWREKIESWSAILESVQPKGKRSKKQRWEAEAEGLPLAICRMAMLALLEIKK